MVVNYVTAVNFALFFCLYIILSSLETNLFFFSRAATKIAHVEVAVIILSSSKSYCLKGYRKLIEAVFSTVIQFPAADTWSSPRYLVGVILVKFAYSNVLFMS